tara:strand:+ start:587 stop:1129 length:543 start_codon:yes stop_codon:yes gene_type:complete
MSICKTLSRCSALAVLLLCLPAACIKERRYLVMEELSIGAGTGANYGAVVTGDVTGEAHYRQFLTLIADGNLRGTHGTLLTDASHALLEGRVRIPLLDPVVQRLSAIVSGTTRIGSAQRAAMGRALLQAQELGGDVLLAPRVEIVTRSLQFLIPLGWLYSTGSVEVKAKAVRIGPSSADG